MTDTTETYKGKMVCEIVTEPENVGRMITLFELAGSMTDQVAIVRTTRDPGKAGAAVFAERYKSFVPKVLSSLNTLKHALRKGDDRMKNRGLDDLSGALFEDPFHEAGVALRSTVLGATAVFVNVDNPETFRAELGVFKELDRPLEQ